MPVQGMPTDTKTINRKPISPGLPLPALLLRQLLLPHSLIIARNHWISINYSQLVYIVYPHGLVTRVLLAEDSSNTREHPQLLSVLYHRPLPR